MKVGIVGAGRIGGGIARQLVTAGHHVVLSFSREPARLERLADELGPGATVGSAADAVRSADVVVISVPWSLLPDALAQMGSVEGKIVVDTTNQFGTPMPPEGQTAAQFNQQRLKGCRYTKSFNTLTAAFQADASTRRGNDRVVQWICGDDAGAKALVSALVEDAGFVPVDLGPTSTCAVMEAPRRPGAVYGEEYRAADAGAVVEAVRSGGPIPPPPDYS
jgi:8-hydroxy-5-deazaflavin:NADPH oxidoreductase